MRISLSLLQVIGTVALLVFVIYLAGFFDQSNRIEFYEILKNPNWFWLVACILISLFLTILSAFKWWCLINSSDPAVNLWRTWGYYMVGMFYNLFLPTSVGGDAVRSYSLGKFIQDQPKALASVFVERYTGLLTLLFFSMIAIAVNASFMSQQVITISLVGFAFALGAIGYLAFSKTAIFKLGKMLGWAPQIVNKILNKLTKFSDAVESYKGDKFAILIAIINSMIFYIVAVLNVYATANVFSNDVSFIAIILATPVIMLLMNIPLSIGNYGIMEFAYVLTFELLGLGAVLGASTALLMRLKTFIDGLIGVFFIKKTKGAASVYEDFPH